MEQRDHGGALETAGGIAKALPQLAPDGVSPFWVVSGDVFLPGFDFPAEAAAAFAASALLGQLWLVPNALHHPQGDFGLSPDGLALRDAPETLTWASVGLFRPALFADVPVGTRLALRPKLDEALAAGRLGAQRWAGAWTDVGTVERLARLQA
jgi:MurNAc alpha-1-phosphate uridylyltransferase